VTFAQEAAPRQKDREINAQRTSSSPRKRVSNSQIDPAELLAIACGGALGVLARIGLAQALPVDAGQWPWATFAVNIAGALMLGYFVTRWPQRLPASKLRRPLLDTGFCGALTTFSTVQIELLNMTDRGAYGLAIGYLSASLLCGYLAVFASTTLVRRVRRSREQIVCQLDATTEDT
jgi:CrcB protein